MLQIHLSKLKLSQHSSTRSLYQHPFCFNDIIKTLSAEEDCSCPFTAPSHSFAFSANISSSFQLVDDTVSTFDPKPKKLIFKLF